MTTFSVEKPQDSPGFLLWQITIIWQRIIKKVLDKYAISHAQFVILALMLWFEERQITPTQVMIVQMSKLDKMTVSQSLKKLVERDFIKRFENAKDTRAKSVSLTAPGKEMAITLVPMIEKVDSAFFKLLPQGDQDSFIRIAHTLIEKGRIHMSEWFAL